MSIIIKFLETKEEKNHDSSQKETTYYLQGKYNSNNSVFLMRNYGVDKVMTWHFSHVGDKGGDELLTKNSISSA